VPVRPFGKTGVKVSQLALGGYFDTARNLSLIEQAAGLGITFWETTYKFGGEGYGVYFKKNPESRKDIFLLAKTPSKDPGPMVQDLDRALETMNTSYIDLFVIHAVDNINCLSSEIRKLVEELKRKGKIKFFGFTTHSNMEACMTGAAGLGWIDGIVTTYNYRLMHTDSMKKAVDSCANAGIGLVAIKSQAEQAHPTANVGVESESSLRLTEHFLKKGFSLYQAKLRAIWENPCIATICSMMPNMTILLSNAAAASDRTKFSSDDLSLLKSYADETTSYYCSGCSHICESAVADDVPISNVMRYLMYYHAYGDHHRARCLYKELPVQIRENITAYDYSFAEKRCPRKMAIGQLIRQAAKELA
jgi:predicted aldo/keto reductase-like oxidoreductase